MPAPSTLTAEADFAKNLGLERELVRQARQRLLRDGEHFEQKKGGPILLTEPGLQILLTHFSTAKKSAPPEEVILVTVRQVPNPRQVLARRETDDPQAPPELVLRVPTQLEQAREVNFFTPGLRVRATHVDGATWQYQGPRPRFRGDRTILAPLPAPVAPAEPPAAPPPPVAVATPKNNPGLLPSLTALPLLK